MIQVKCGWAPCRKSGVDDANLPNRARLRIWVTKENEREIVCFRDDSRVLEMRLLFINDSVSGLRCVLNLILSFVVR